jgi:hypothetical protein
MRKLALIVLALVLLGVTPSPPAPAGGLGVQIDGARFLLDGEFTNAGGEAEGLLLNARMIQGVIHDYNAKTRDLWRYPGSPWDPDRNTSELIARLPEYTSRGLDMITVGLQGGAPRYQCEPAPGSGRNFSLFTSDGTLRSDAKVRLERLIFAARDAGILVQVSFWYQNQDSRIDDNAAVIEGTRQATLFLKGLDAGNVLIEIANEVSVNNYQHTALQPAAIDDRMRQVHGLWPTALVTASMQAGGKLGVDAQQAEQDYTSFHGNGLTKAETLSVISKAKNDPQLAGKPIVITEDYWHDDNGATAAAAVNAGAGWGYYEPCGPGSYEPGSAKRYRDGYQSPPVNWGINTARKQAFFDFVDEVGT